MATEIVRYGLGTNNWIRSREDKYRDATTFDPAKATVTVVAEEPGYPYVGAEVDGDYFNIHKILHSFDTTGIDGSDVDADSSYLRAYIFNDNQHTAEPDNILEVRYIGSGPEHRAFETGDALNLEEIDDVSNPLIATVTVTGGNQEFTFQMEPDWKEHIAWGAFTYVAIFSQLDKDQQTEINEPKENRTDAITNERFSASGIRFVFDVYEYPHKIVKVETTGGTLEVPVIHPDSDRAEGGELRIGLSEGIGIIPLSDVNFPYASPFRIETASGVKALEIKNPEFPDGDGYVFNQGTHYNMWEQGHMYMTHEAYNSHFACYNNENERVRASASAQGWTWEGDTGQTSAEANCVTRFAVDLTEVNSIDFNYDSGSSGPTPEWQERRFIITSDPKAEIAETAVVKTITPNPQATTDSLDVSDLTGFYYLRLVAYVLSQDGSVTTIPSSVWLNMYWIKLIYGN